MQSHVFYTLEMPSGGQVPVKRYRFGSKGTRVAFVAGIRGDAPEGIRVAFRLMKSLESLEEHLDGIVDVYPCINPLAAEQGERLWPAFGIDQNRQFPGKPNGHPPSQLAHRLLEDLRDVDLVIELRGARPGFEELPQAMIQERFADKELSSGVTLLDVARHCNTSIVWKRTNGPSAERTFAYQFGLAIILEGGQGNRLTAKVGDVLGEGCIYLLTRTGILPEALLPFPWMAMEDPLLANDTDIIRVRASYAGLFLPTAMLGDTVLEADEIGIVVDPRSGQTIETIQSTVSGLIIAVRNQPVVTSGEMVARIHLRLEME